MINAAIIGLGRWGQILVNSVQGKSDKIKIIAGRTETLSDNAKAFAGSHGFPLTASYNDLLQRSDIDYPTQHPRGAGPASSSSR